MDNNNLQPAQRPEFGPHGITANMAENALNRLRALLVRTNVSIEDISIFWMDADGDVVLARRGAEMPFYAYENIRVLAYTAMRENKDYLGAGAMRIVTGKNVRGVVGVVADDPNLRSYLAVLTSELTVDPHQPLEFLGILVEEQFITDALNMPDLHYELQAPYPVGVSSQAGIASVIEGARQQGLLPGGIYGVPPLGEPSLPRPALGVDLITGVPGFGGGLHG